MKRREYLRIIDPLERKEKLLGSRFFFSPWNRWLAPASAQICIFRVGHTIHGCKRQFTGGQVQAAVGHNVHGWTGASAVGHNGSTGASGSLPPDKPPCTRVWCVWVWLCPCPLMGAATQFSSGQRRLAIWIRHVVPAVGAASPAASWAEEGAQLLLGRRRELGPSVRPAAQIHGGHVHDSTPARCCH